MQNSIIYLFGFPATGKYTIAKEITKQIDAVLIDNHYINNPVLYPSHPNLLELDVSDLTPQQATNQILQHVS